MSNESIKATNPSLLKEMSGSLAFSGAITGFGGLTSVARNRGVKNAINSMAIQDFKNLNIALKDSGKDVFTRSLRTGQNYEIYKDLSKKFAKSKNMLNKAGDNLSLVQRFKNVFRSQEKKLTVEIVKNDYIEPAKKAVDNAKGIINSPNIANFDLLDDALKNTGTDLKKAQNAVQAIKTAQEQGIEVSQEILEEAGKLKSATKAASAAEATAKIAAGSAKDTVKGLFKSELKNKFVLAITIAGAIPRIKDEIIPAFKEKGFFEGIKTTGKVIARTGADFISNAGFSAVGRALGTVAGTFLCPGAGSAIGGMFGDVVGSFFSMKLISKIFDKNENKEETQTQPGEENKLDARA